MAGATTQRPGRRGGRRTESDVEATSFRGYLDSIGQTALLTAADEVDLARRIEAGMYAQHKLGDPSATLTSADRRDLAAVAGDGRQAKTHMVRANLRLVVSVAKKYSYAGVPFLDVVQEGNLGLIHAVEKFDYTKGFKFSTYAVWWIRQAITRSLAEQSRVIRLPVHMVEQINRLRRIQRELLVTLGREPTQEELALEAERTVEQVEDMLRLTSEPFSLDAPVTADGDTVVGDLVADREATAPSSAMEAEAARDQVRAALEVLPDREARILTLRFGLADGRPRTLEETGRELGLTRERIRQLEKAALAALRAPEHLERLRDLAA